MLSHLDSLVAEAYHNARENGYDFDSAEEWAEDMVTCCSDLEDEAVDDVVASINRQGLLK